jgi:hypothetical protein
VFEEQATPDIKPEMLSGGKESSRARQTKTISIKPIKINTYGSVCHKAVKKLQVVLLIEVLHKSH